MDPIQLKVTRPKVISFERLIDLENCNENTVALLLVLLTGEYVYAQTAADIQKKYGKPVDVYSVSEHVWMTPEYARTDKSVVCGSILNASVLIRTRCARSPV